MPLDACSTTSLVKNLIGGERASLARGSVSLQNWRKCDFAPVKLDPPDLSHEPIAMSGLEVLSAVAACVELVRVVHSALTLLNDARETSKHATEQYDLQFILLVQATRHEAWCNELGMSKVYFI